MSYSDEDSSYKKRTDCCGSTGYDDAATCPDCGHVCCESCEVSTSRGLCWCQHSLRGDASSDQATLESRGFFRSMFGYRGKFKGLAQVRMEKKLMGPYGRSQARVNECAYNLCNATADGWSREHPPARTKLTDDNVGDFVVCPKCRSTAYCSTACMEADAITATWNSWDGEQKVTHAEICEPYLDNERQLPYVSVALRKYKKEFGRFPHPLGPSNVGGEERSVAKSSKGFVRGSS